MVQDYERRLEGRVRGVMFLSSIAACRKALDYLSEASECEAADVVLRSVPCPKRTQGSNGEPEPFPGHLLILQDDNSVVCRACGKVFRSKRRELTREDRIVFESLSPKRSFDQQFGL